MRAGAGKPTAEKPLDELLRRGYRFAYSLTHNNAVAEDLLQDAWLSVLKVSGPWTIPYLFKAIRSRFIDAQRRSKSVVFQPFGDLQMGGMVAENDDPSGVKANANAALANMNGSLGSALERLRPEERAVLYLAAVEGYTATQAAELLDCPRGTVLSLMFRARRKVRDWVGADAEAVS